MRRALPQLVAAVCLAAVMLLPAGRLSAQESQSAPADTQAAAARSAWQGSAGSPAITRHTIALAGHEVAYTATAGFLTICDESGKPEARIFYTSYVRDGADANRPVTFAFNGGPGAASLWLHLGAMGPRRVLLDDDGKVLPKNIRLADNESTWLDFTDLVFIDPVGAGYSLPAPGVDAKQFYGIEGDTKSVGEFIRQYVSSTGRWLSPKFLAGESYGATRAVSLAKYLPDRAAMNLNGLILLSSAISFQTFCFEKSNELPYVLYVPSYAAVAWYHHKLPPDLQQQELETVLTQARQWAGGEYAPALAQGDDLPEAQRKKIVESLCRFTGLSAAYVERANLRVTDRRFAKELLRDEGKIVGILDARVTGAPTDRVTSVPDRDPAMFLVEGSFAAAIQDYYRRDLGVRCDRKYETLSSKANQSWNWGSAVGGWVDVTDELQEAMTANPNLKVFAGVGYYDLTIGYWAQQYGFSHLGLAPPLRANLEVVAYPAGHQIYNHPASLKKLHDDAAAFLREAQ